MGELSRIEWTDATFNGWIGCQHVSPGCDKCYAERDNAFRKWTADGQWGPHAERRRTSAANWKKPVAWNRQAGVFLRMTGRRRRIFSASLSDWLDNAVPQSWRLDLCTLIEATPDLDWLLLTKRIENYPKLAPSGWQAGPPANVWLGTTTEDGEHYRRRWSILREIPAVVRFVSYEPALGALGKLDLDGSGRVPDWVICGGESGPRARPMQEEWAIEALAECRAHGVAFFMKQWGHYSSNPLSRELSLHEVKQRDPPSNGKGGALLRGQLYREFPTPRPA
jgi:protein gp37